MGKNEFLQIGFEFDSSYLDEKFFFENEEAVIERHIYELLRTIPNIKDKIGLERTNVRGGKFIYNSNFIILTKDIINDIFNKIKNEDDKREVYKAIFEPDKVDWDFLSNEQKVFRLEYRKRRLELEILDINYDITKLKASNNVGD